MWWLVFPAVLLAFVIFIVIRAFLFKPYDSQAPKTQEFEIDEENIVNRFSKIISCKTISNRDLSKVNIGEFEKVQDLIKKFYPNIFKICEFEKVLQTGLLFKWPGEKSDEPVVLMAHYDVVPANEQQWEKPAFDGIIENNELWGRGTLDTKCTFVAILEASEQLIKTGFKPKNDIYLSFAGDEEVAGPTCPAIVDLLKQRNIHPAMVLDEGGAVVENVFPGVRGKCALVGIAEKGITDIRMSMKSSGGHASAPPPHTIIGQLSQAVVDIENHPFSFQLTPPVSQMFDILGRHSSFVFKIIFANLWCFKPILNLMCKKTGGELNALMRTTVAFTMAQGSQAANVLPPSAEFTANLRLLGKDTYESAVLHMKKVTDNPDILFEVIHGSNGTTYSSTDCIAWDTIKNAISQTWPDALVSPYLMFAASDSRHFCKITDKVYKFSGMHLTKEQRGYIHGNNERISLDAIYDLVRFYLRLISLV